MQAGWLAWFDKANRQPVYGQPGSDEWHAATNAISAGFIVTALLGELAALNPARADALAGELHTALEHDHVTELLDAWRVLAAAGQPVRVYEAAEAAEALNRLHHREPQTAAHLNHRWAIAHELSATGVVASVLYREIELGPPPPAPPTAPTSPTAPAPPTGP
jgi:hypothetical protein